MAERGARKVKEKPAEAVTLLRNYITQLVSRHNIACGVFVIGVWFALYNKVVGLVIMAISPAIIYTKRPSSPEAS